MKTSLLISNGGGGILGQYRLTVGTTSTYWGYSSGWCGAISPNTFEGKTITGLYQDFNNSSGKNYAHLYISGLSGGTIYYGRYDTKQIVPLEWHDGNSRYQTYSYDILTEADVGKTVQVYLGRTQPEF